MHMSRLLVVALLSAIVVPASAQTDVPVGSFRSIELHHGGKVFVRHGQTQRVTITSGDRRFTRVRLDGQRLVIDNCNPDCPREYRMQMEIVTPRLEAVSVSNGGSVQSVGAFPVQAELATDVEQGGMIDVRSIPAEVAEASVYSGGGIFLRARQSLTASVVSGGNITYWGATHVRESVRDGGVVKKGRPADVDKPVSDFGPAPPPPVPPVPPIPPH